MKKLSTLVIAIMLSACVGMGGMEKEALKSAAIESVRSQSKEVHLAYLQCYGLNQQNNKSCRRKPLCA